jgi:hypothetical protein
MKKRVSIMQGNGNASSPAAEIAAPQSSRSMWANMFGLGPLLDMIGDPQMMAHAHAVMQAMIEGANASRRLEAKLDLILRGLGHDPQSVHPADLRSAALPAADGAAGDRGFTVASLFADDGDRQPPTIDQAAISGPRRE